MVPFISVSNTKRGRPAGAKKGVGEGKVRYTRRVLPNVVAKLDALLAGAMTADVAELAKAKKDAALLLDDVVRLTAEVEGLKAKLERCARATDDEKCRRWIFLYDELKAKLAGSGEFDQTAS